MARLAVISDKTVRGLLTRQLAFEAVRAAFESVATDQSRIYEVVVGYGLGEGEAFALKSGNESIRSTVGFKCGTYWAGNNGKGIPAHGSTILLLDPETGFPKVLVNASYLNGYRTAAANALAVQYLARPDASVLGVIGAGHQAEHEIRAVAEVRELELVKVFTRSTSRARWMADQLEDFDVEVRFLNVEEVVRDSDIVATVTPAESPLVRNEWVAPGTHISAMGADDAGKHELDTEIVIGRNLFADYPDQSVVIGEFQHGFMTGDIPTVDHICALGLVTLGRAPGRQNDEEVTIFDSSGIAIQDLMAAAAIYEAAEAAGRIEFIDF